MEGNDNNNNSPAADAGDEEFAALGAKVDELMGSGSFAEAAAVMEEAIRHERGRGKRVSALNLCMDLCEVYRSIEDDPTAAKKAKDLLAQVDRERREAFSDEDRAKAREAEQKALQASKDAKEAIEGDESSEQRIDAVLDELESAFQSVRALFGEGAVSSLRMAMAHVHFRLNNDPESALDELLEIPEPDYDALKMTYEVQVQLEDLAECYKTLRQMKRLYSKEHGDSISKMRAFLLYKDGKLQESLALYRELQKKASGTGPEADAEVSSLCTITAKVLHDLGEFDEAVTELRRALALQSSSPASRAKTLYMLSKTLESKKDFSGALEAADQMRECLDKQDLFGHVTCTQLRAMLAHRLGRSTDAIELLKQAEQDCAKQPQRLRGVLLAVYDDLGSIYYDLGDEANILKYYDLAHPEDERHSD